jgi:predicted nucleotidyltransferase
MFSRRAPQAHIALVRNGKEFKISGDQSTGKPGAEPGVGETGGGCQLAPVLPELQIVRTGSAGAADAQFWVTMGVGRFLELAYEELTMNREKVIARLRQNEPTLRERGVVHAALFGSRARGDFRAGSDTDILIELDPSARITVFDYAGIKDFIAELLDGPVDVVDRNALKPYVKPAATADAVYAF